MHSFEVSYFISFQRFQVNIFKTFTMFSLILYLAFTKNTVSHIISKISFYHFLDRKDVHMQLSRTIFAILENLTPEDFT